MSLLSQKSQNSCFCPNLCHLIGSLTHLLVKIISLDHFDANIDGIVLNLEYWGEKAVLLQCFLQALENEDKIMICSFFKFSPMKHFFGSKSIAWVDFRVVLMIYSFQGVRIDLQGEFEKLTKYAKICKYSKSMLLDFDSIYQWKNSSPPLCVIDIRKHLDLLFHLVNAELVF